MQFIIEGCRLSGKNIKQIYIDYKVCRFEYECMIPISSFVVLYQKDHRGLKQLKIHVLEV